MPRPSCIMASSSLRSRMSILLLLILYTELTHGKLILPSWDEQSVVDDYDLLKFPPDRPPGFRFYSINGTVASTGRNYTAHVALLSRGFPQTFSFRLPLGGCCHRNKTSGTAKLYNCTYATNAGFFKTLSNCCVGNLIINSRPIQLPASNRANFALTSDSFLVGYLTNETLNSGKLNFSQLISGAGWLIRKGKENVNESVKTEVLPEGFVNEKAPRTTIAIAANGTLFLVQVDGEEDIKEGLDLYEMAGVLLQLGAWQAVNLDGGGSSVSVYEGRVVSKPTCIDTHVICERPVSSISCIQNIQ